MWRFIFLIIIFNSVQAIASTVSCAITINTNNKYNFTLPTISTDKFMAGLSANNSQYRKLYTWDYFMGMSTGYQCATSPNVSYSVYEYIASNYGEPTFAEGEWIFPTSTKGIGISFYERDYKKQPIGPVSNPLKVADWTTGTKPSARYTLSTRVTLWKIPGEVGLADSNGKFNIDGFRPVIALKLNNSGDTFSSLPSDQSSFPMPRSFNITSATVNGSISFVPGTCNFTNKTVEMGTYTRSELTNNSPWVNASFTLSCPQAWGYGSTATMAQKFNTNTVKSRSSNTSTSGIIVTVSPRNGTVDGTRGIIGLKPGGAEGYGIQLAWGDSASLSASDPLKPVLFGQSQVVSNENFGTSGNTYTREIKMAARYIRTSGSVQPGRADSAIEILASYN